MGDANAIGNVLLVMGPAGAGKTTVARRLAAELNFDFVEGDAFHPPANVAKMRAGIALDERDRAPWLAALRRAVEDAAVAGRSIVVACSALRRPYREALLDGLPRVATVFLAGAQHLLHDRVAQRSGHYMPAELLDSQLTALEPPARLFARDPLRFGPWTDRALFVDAASPVAEIERAVLDRLDPPRDAT
jgi:gluconokinase